MRKKQLSMLLAGALVASVFTALPAQSAPTVPAEPNIVDPAGDGNYVHDGHSSALAPIGRNHTTPAGSINGTGDILGVWFSHDAQNIRVHVHSAVSPPSGWGLNYTVYASPGEGSEGSSTVGCLRFTTLIPGSNQGGGTYQGKPVVLLHDRCNTGGNFFSNGVPGEFIVDTLDDGSGITTTTWPRSASPLLADGLKVAAPSATAAPYTTGADGAGFVAVAIDNTDVGLDYELQGGGGAPPVVVDEPEEPKPEPPVKKGCKKNANKGKKKGCKKGKGPKEEPKGASCAAYQPGEMGAEAETTVVTDAATEEAPLVVEIPLGQALGRVNSSVDFSTRIKWNVQLDSSAAEAGMFMKLISPDTDDPDLYVYWDNGTQAAVAGGFNQALVAGPIPSQVNSVWNLNGTGSGGHSGFGYEQIDGLRTADCGGWTLDLVNWAGVGGTYELHLWTGEIMNDPAAREA